ncbi:hypothetical protein [Anoxybacillus flavithermus]|uniref:Uncharacterized protein n=1 Tax=Anoxybacillus flavithermus NBRC 109594 TaxID=1315967 RepID=R4G163_9BACL|nr:hypothetical protein [Anoxybacillus flavithermus]GAC91618.1 hypothetical protein KN10_2054 [Anoxybacillus flavithermus NBRC 109594]
MEKQLKIQIMDEDNMNKLNELLKSLKEAESTLEGRADLQSLNWSTSLE